MTVLQDVVEGGARDPFAIAQSARGPSRPRLLSFVGRWGRARRWLPPEALRVLDVGCSFGYGTAAIGARGPAGRVVAGVERDPSHLKAARRRFPWVTIIEGDATALPAADATADAVLLLDIVEHLADPEQALAEARRVLRPGGVVIVSVPHRGVLRGLDSLNVYAALRRRWPQLPPLEPATESGGGMHRHFSAQELEELLGPSFTVERVARTGLGLQEFVHLALVVVRAVGMPRVCRALMPLHLLVYLVDDAVPWGPLAYHLTVRARATQVAAAR